MNTKLTKKSLAVALGTVVVGSLSVASIAQAASNPFDVSELSSSHIRIAEAGSEEGQCGEAKCGGNKKKKAATDDAKVDSKKGEEATDPVSEGDVSQ